MLETTSGAAESNATAVGRKGLAEGRPNLVQFEETACSSCKHLLSWELAHCSVLSEIGSIVPGQADWKMDAGETCCQKRKKIKLLKRFQKSTSVSSFGYTRQPGSCCGSYRMKPCSSSWRPATPCFGSEQGILAYY